jgi:hypothetical protein
MAFDLIHEAAFYVIAILSGCYILKSFFWPNPNEPTKQVPKGTWAVVPGWELPNQ